MLIHDTFGEEPYYPPTRLPTRTPRPTKTPIPTTVSNFSVGNLDEIFVPVESLLSETGVFVPTVGAITIIGLGAYYIKRR